MPYSNNSDLPERVQQALPDHAQDIFREAFNSAWDEYKDEESRRDNKSREETAYAVAWNAVKKEYVKDDKTGIWEKI